MNMESKLNLKSIYTTFAPKSMKEREIQMVIEALYHGW